MQRTKPFDPTGAWEDFARCRSGDAELFFASGAQQESRAKVVCKGCPVRFECLAYALKYRVEHGVWGGMTDRERRRVLNRSNATVWDPEAAMRAAAPIAS